MLSPLLSKQQAAERLGISPRNLTKLISAGAISYRRVGRLVRISETDLAEYLERIAVPARSGEGGGGGALAS